MRVFYFFAAFFLTGSLAVWAQDTRTVTEPHIPAPCITLEAHIRAKRGVIGGSDETSLDTQRIQHAIDRCPTGKAVALRATGDRQVFLTGPLQLRTGVTLVVDADTILAASRDPRQYDLRAVSCGVVNDNGHGCKPLISADHAENSGIVGDGAIDGRGGAKLLGQNVSGGTSLMKPE